MPARHFRICCNTYAANVHAAACGGHKTCQYAHGSALTRPVRAKKADHLALANAKRNIVNGFYRTVRFGKSSYDYGIWDFL